MKNITGDLFAQQCDAICITTNGFTKSNGSCVMGRGCAAQAVKLWPSMPARLGALIREHGNRTMVVGSTPTYAIVAFPVKPVSELFNGSNAVKHMLATFKANNIVPGWACLANPKLIKRSAEQLVQIADKRGWQRIILPRPGCGAGELKWSAVEPILQAILDDRFHAITFSRG